jgi:hypothetical protein
MRYSIALQPRFSRDARAFAVRSDANRRRRSIPIASLRRARSRSLDIDAIAAKSDERVVTHRRRLRNPLDVARRRVARAPDRVDGSRAMLAASRTSRVGVATRARVARGV